MQQGQFLHMYNTRAHTHTHVHSFMSLLWHTTTLPPLKAETTCSKKQSYFTKVKRTLHNYKHKLPESTVLNRMTRKRCIIMDGVEKKKKAIHLLSSKGRRRPGAEMGTAATL
uniref:Uncharacterized protein n=1 Tax=Amblyomma tuberculatum TaxID=48802 RepID=A0A6M2E4N6_9ACAR